MTTTICYLWNIWYAVSSLQLSRLNTLKKQKKTESDQQNIYNSVCNTHNQLRDYMVLDLSRSSSQTNHCETIRS